MYFTDRVKKNILSAAILLVVLFIATAPAHANVTASPASIKFGNQTVGTVGSPITVTVTNTETGIVKIASVSLSPVQFSYSGPSLPMTLNPGQSLTASVTFTPSAAQAYSGTLTFRRGGSSIISVSL